MGADIIEGEYEVDASIVKAGGIDRVEDFDPRGFFDGEVTAQTAVAAVKYLKLWEDYLRAVDEYADKVCEFALKEAYAYIKISEFDGAEAKLSDAKQRLVNWIRLKVERGEIDDVLQEVSGGKRIHFIMQREMKDNAKDIKAKAAEKEYKRIADSIVNKLVTTGHTTLTPSTFVEQWSSAGQPNPHTIKAYTESTRDRILHRKGRGLGDSKGTYMLVEKCSRDDTAQIIKTRLESIVNDLKVIKEICDETHFVIPSEGVEIIVNLIKSLRDSNNILELSL